MVYLMAGKVVYAVVCVRLAALLLVDPYDQVLGLSVIGVAMIGSGLIIAFDALDMRR